MKHEPRPAILMEKPLLTAVSWVGQSLALGISRTGQTVLARLMESHICHLLAGSVALPTFLSGRKLSPSSCLDARHFSSSLFAPGAFQTATPVLELRGSESE